MKFEYDFHLFRVTDQDSNSKKNNKKAATKPKSQSSSVTKPKPTSKVDKVASKSTFLGGGAPTQKVQQTASKPKPVKKPATPKKTVTTQERINQKSYGTTTPKVKPRTQRDTKPVTSTSQRRKNAEANMNLKQTKIAEASTRRTQNEVVTSQRQANRDANLNLKQTVGRESRARQRDTLNRVDTAARNLTDRSNRWERSNLSARNTELDNQRRAKANRTRTLRQAQKSGDYDKVDRLTGVEKELTERRTAQFKGKEAKPLSARAKVSEWDRDISDTITHTVKQGLAADARVGNISMKGITQKDAFLYTSQEQRDTADKKFAQRDQKLGKRIEAETKAIEDIQNKHGYLGRQALSAVSSATGMGMDIAAGAIIPGSSLFHMWTRSTGSSIGEVSKKADNLRKQLKATGQYSDEELDEMFKNVSALDLANAGASGGIEVLSELLFPGIGAARKVIGGKGASIAERAGAKLFNRLGERATGGLLRNITRGTLEEIAEEEIGGPLQAATSNLIYGNKFQGYNEDAIKRSLTAESNALRSNIQSEADAQAAAARLSSKSFMDQSIQSYMQSGYSKAEATRLAEMSRDYLTASLSGDVDGMKKYQDDMVKIMAGGENSMKQKFGLQDMVDAAVSTSMMTLVTGAPAAFSTMSAGNAYKSNVGLDAIKQQAEMIKNWESDPKEKAKAQAVIDHIDNGGDLSGTQVYEIVQKAGEMAAERQKPEQTKDRVAQVEMNKRDLRISPVNPDGSLAPQTQRRYEQIVSDTVSRHETLARLSNNADQTEDFVGPAATFERRNANTETENMSDVVIGANIGAAFEVGAINAEMVNELARGSETVKSVFREVTGIDVSQFSSYNEMNESLMAEAADKLVNSARLEQVAWNDEARKQVSDEVRSDVLGSQGDLAIQDALESVDPRDRTQFLMTADVASNLYDFARHTEGSWNEARQLVKRMYPSVDTNVMKQIFVAAKEDKQIAETEGYGKVVTSGQTLDRSSLKGEAPAYVPGKFIDNRENKEGATLTEESLPKSIASAFGINVMLVDNPEVRDEKGNLIVNLASVVKDRDGNDVLDEEGNPVIQMDNGAFIPSTNTLVINANADATRTITQTAVHELTHHIAVHAPAEYVKLSQYIMDAWYRKDAEGFTRAIRARQAAYKAQKNQTLSDEQALEEIIADGAADFDWSDADFIAEVTTKEPTLANKIIDAIKEVLQKIRSILSSGSVIDERARDALYDKAVELDTVRSLWVKAAQTARKAQADQAIIEAQEEANRASKSTRYSVPEYTQKEMDAHRQALVDEVSEYYDSPYTDNYAEAGFVFPDGQMLRMGMGGQRAEDHRIASHAYDDISDREEALNSFINEGNIRWMPELATIEFGASSEPTAEQYAWIRDVARNYSAMGGMVQGVREIDFTDKDGDTLESKLVTRENPDAIINDIKRFYKSGTTEGGSQLSQFRYSLSPEQIEKAVVEVGPMVRFSTPTYREIQPKAIYKSGVGFADYFKDASGRDLTYEWTKNNFSEAQAKAVVAYMDKMAEWFEETGEGSLKSTYRFIGWNDLTDANVQVKTNDAGEIVGVTVSAMVKNGEYPVNFDLTTVCNKREGITNVIKNLIDKKVDGESVLHSIKLTDANMWKINQALKAEGIDTACLGCFVEARRYYAQRFMDKIEDKWNKAVRQARKELGLPENEYFDFAKGRAVTGEEWSSIDSLWTAYDESTESKSSPADRIKILMDEIVRNKDVNSPYLKQIRISDILTPEGINGFKQLSNKGHDMVKTIKSIYGTSAPKEILAFTPYNSEIALLPDEMKGMETGEYLKSIGGIRVQSFSDFKIAHVFEHFQMVADEAARKFYTHGYSKVIAFPRIFGLTGRKINMSVMFDVLNNKAWSQALGIPVRKAATYAKKYQGLQFVRELPAENKDNRPYKEVEIEGVHGYLTYLVSDADYVNSIFDREYRKNIEAGMSEDEARRKANESKPYEQSINYREAVELENQDGYKENVGIIAVAYGDEHLKMLLADPNVRYVIPYHKSGLPTFISKKTALAVARDYTNFQNTNIAESWKNKNGKNVDLKEEYEAFKKDSKSKYPAIDFFKQINDNNYKVKFGSKTASEKAAMAGTADFDVYAPLETAKDIREVSNAYLEHCIEKGWCPIFHEFAGDPNYYKMLFDFAVTDGSFNNIYPQRTVRNRYPGLDIDAKVAAGEEITDADLVELKKAVMQGAETENKKNMTMAQNMPNVMNDILTRGSENSIIDDTNLNSIRWDTPDYTDVKLGNEEMTPAEGPSDVRHSIAVNFDDAYMDAVESNDMDEAQRLVDEAAKAAGMKVAHRYHGTMNAGFTVFDKAYAKVGGNSGAGFYFSTEKDDSVNHYADVEGADNYFKWSSLAEHINDQINEGTWEGPELETYEDVEEYAKEQLNKNPGTYDVYLNYKNPYIRDYKNSTNIYDMLMDDFDESVIDRDDYEDEWEYEDAVWEAKAEHLSDSLYSAVYGAYQDIEDNYEVIDMPYIDEVLSKITEYAFDGSLTWEEIQNGIVFAGEVEVTNPNWTDSGDATSEFTRAIIENLGFDAIEDKEVNSKFGQLSREMMTDTEHIIVFKPEQIKLSDPVTYAEDGSVIPLSERFDPTNNDIRYSLPTQDTEGNILTDGQMEYFKNSQARDEQGRLVPVYHTTNYGGFTIFDPSYSDDKRSLFFASNFDVSQTYGRKANKPIDIQSKIPTFNSIEDFSAYASENWSDLGWKDTQSFALNTDLQVRDNSSYQTVRSLDRAEDWVKGSADYDRYAAVFKVPNENTGFWDTIMAYSPDGIVDAINKHYQKSERQAGFYQVYLNLENPLIVDAHGANWSAIAYGGEYQSAINIAKEQLKEDTNLAISDVNIEYDYDDDGWPESIYLEVHGQIKTIDGKWVDLNANDDYSGDITDDPISLSEQLESWAMGSLEGLGLNDDFIDSLFSDHQNVMSGGYDYHTNNLTGYEWFNDQREWIGEEGYLDEEILEASSPVAPTYSTRELAEMAEANGNDGVIIRNCRDIGGVSSLKGGNPISDILIAFSSNQVKDTRNVDPTNNPDIRYSIIPEDEAMSRMAYDDAMDNSYELLTYYEQQLDIVNPETFDVTKAFREEDVVRFLDALKAEDAVPSSDAAFEEDRVRRAKSKAEFYSNVNAKWNERWITEGEVLKISSVKRAITNLVKGAMANSNSDAQYRNEIVRKTLIDARIAYQLMKQDRTELASYLLYHSAQRMMEGLEFIRDDTAFKEYQGIRDFLRSYRINAPDEFWENEPFLEFRKEYYGRLRIGKGNSNIEDVYGDLQSRWPHLFNEEERVKADLKDKPWDLLQHIGVVVDSNVTPFMEAYSSEEATSLAFDLADQLYEIIANGDREVSLADSYKERFDARTKAMKQRHYEAILRERKIRDEGIQKERQKFREYKERQKEKRLHTKYFEGIKNKYDELTKRLLTNTKDKHIPEQYKKELAELLKAFDFQTVRSKEREARTGYKAQNTIKLEAMRTALERIEANSQLFHINDSITDIMKDLLGLDDSTANKQSIEGKTLDELNASELKKIDNLLGALIHEFNNYEKVKVGVKKAQAADIGHAQNNISLEHAKTFGPGRDYQNTPGWIDKILNLDEMTAAYLFKRIDPNKEGLGLMFGEIRKSFDKYVRNQNQLNNWMEEIVGKYHNKGILWNKYGSGELSNWRSDNYAQTFNLEHGPLRLTIAQMMSVYCLAKRQQAYDHMVGAGVVVSPVTFQAKITSDLKKKVNKAVPQKLTDADIKTIAAALTPEQRQVANKLQELMATKMAAWGNEASINVLGIKLFEDPDYFPIRSDKAGLTKDLDPNQFEQAIRNFGFTKAVQPGARNAIMIDDIFDVVTEHCNNMNLYNSYTEAMNDFMKVYNYREVREDGEYTVEQALGHAFSNKAPTFIMQFMRDLNGNVSKRSSGIEDAYNSMLANSKKAAVFANLRVAAQQPTAITRAFAVINPKYLKGIKIEKGAMTEMFEHCPIALWKSWGYYDINMGKSIEDIMMNNGRWLEDKATDLYGMLDNVTWTAIWQMVKAEMKDTHPNVKIGSDEYWDLCNERMSEVVDLTQVVDSPMHRSHAMRDKGFLKKTATAFMAEPTLTFNMIRDGWISAREAWKSGDKVKAEKIKWRTIGVALLQAASVGGMAAIVDALRKKKPDKDDDDEGFLHLWWVNALENFKDELKLWNKVYFVKDIASTFEGWENSNLALQGIQKFALGYRQLTGDPYARSSAEWYENMADGIGYMWGIPIKTMRTGLKNAMNGMGLASPFLESVGDRLSSVAKDNKSDNKEVSGFIGTLLSDEDSKGMFGKLLTAKSEDVVSETTSADDLPDNLTDEQKEEIRKAAEKRADKAKSAEEQEERDYDTMLYDAMKASAGYEGEEFNRRIWESVSKGYSDKIAHGDYFYVEQMRKAVEAAGGDVEYFDERIMAKTKSEFKKKMVSDLSPEDSWNMEKMKHYMTTNGMSEETISSEIVYKSDLARDLKVAYRINNEEAIQETSEALALAGLTRYDFERLYKNRNRIDLTKYDGKYKDLLKSTGTFIWPVTGPITSHFGYRNSPTAGASSNHPAIDIGIPIGTPVAAADGGVVIYAGHNSGYGNSVGIKHDNGMVTYYNHLDSWNVKVGDTVAQGQQIACSGNTGISTGPHLDFKILDTDGNPVDPEKYLDAR